MKLLSDNINNVSYLKKHQNNKNGVLKDKNPQNLSYGVSFGANLPLNLAETVQKGLIRLTKEDIDKIDDILGNKFFTKQLKKAGYRMSEIQDTMEFRQPTLLKDLFDTLNYPFRDMWLDIASSVLNTMGKTPKRGGIIAKHRAKNDIAKSKELVLDIASRFKEKPEGFIEEAAKNINNSIRNYRSRDERTLNRMLTSTVSAIYSANDFYNISMLQKDDKKEAKKAQDGRFAQEMSRMLLSGGLTFITMGALNKHIKNSMFLSASSIAISALISEVGSRLISHTPLLPLTPKQAKEYAKNNSIQQDDNTQSNQKPKAISFKSNNYENLFKDFAQKDGTISALNMLGVEKNTVSDKNEKNSESKKSSIGTVVLASFATACLLDLFAHKTNAGKAISENWGKIRDKITTKTEVIDGDKLLKFKKDIQDLKYDEQIPSIMKKYSSLLNGQNSLEIKEDRFLISGLYNGITKIFKTMYDILSFPVNFLKYFNKSEVNEEKVSRKTLAKLYSIYKKNLDENGNLNNSKFIEEIKTRTRNFEQGIETGELANFSRTLVTAITSYFFINDYRNKVLIESNGEDVDGARSETRQRLSHKLSNFIINGTIMNLGNSIFKVPLNNSLLAAGAIAVGEETTNEALVRKSICQPIRKKHSRQEILDFEEEQLNKKGLLGAWSRLFRKITGKKTLTEKAGLDKNATDNDDKKQKS